MDVIRLAERFQTRSFDFMNSHLPPYTTDVCSQDQSFDKLRKVYEISRILNDVVDTLLQEAEPGDASRLQDTDVSSFQLAIVGWRVLFLF